MIFVDKQDSIAVLRIVHGKVNAIDLELATEFIEQLQEIETSGSAAVVLTGSGSCFSAGVDLYRIIEGGRDYVREFLPVLCEAFRKLFTLPLPVVTAINGHAIAGGCVLACAADHRIMADSDGRIGIPELLVGVPFPAMPLEIMRYSLSPKHFQNLIYGGNNCLPAEAAEIGLIDQIVQTEMLLESACKKASELSRIPAESFRNTKLLMRQPALDNYNKYKAQYDTTVLKIWLSDAAHHEIRDYLGRTFGEKS